MRKFSPSFNEKINAINQTKDNNADPKMNVLVSRARTTVMDSDYWTVETIRNKAGLGDISVAPRRFKPSGPPNRIYEIHVDNGIVGTAIREYPDKLKEGWKNQFSLGSGVSVGIAFDGDWHKYRGKWRMVTAEKPWIFWVDSDKRLWRKLWDDDSTLEVLDTDVKFVRAIRAWKNRYVRELDQGIVVAYVKTNGSIWYRNYCQQEDGDFIWEIPRQVTGFPPAINLNLFITNDYRMGLTIQDTSGNIHWLITQRNWAGMAIDNETILGTVSNVSIKITEIKNISNKINKEELESTVSNLEVHLCPYDMDIGIISSQIIEPSTVKLKFLYDVIIDSASKDYFKIKNLGIETLPVEAIVGENANEMLLVSSRVLNPYVDTYVSLTDNGTFRLKITPNCKPVVPAFNYIVEQLPPPKMYAKETMEPGVTSVNIIFTRIDWIYNTIEKHLIEPSISEVKIILIKIGTDPI